MHTDAPRPKAMLGAPASNGATQNPPAAAQSSVDSQGVAAEKVVVPPLVEDEDGASSSFDEVGSLLGGVVAHP